MIRIVQSFFAALAFIFVFANSLKAAELIEVFLDARDPAFVVVQGVYDNTPQFAWKEMEGYAQLPKVSLIAWLNFRKHARQFLAPYVKKDEYKGTLVVQGILALLKKYPGRPFAVTWNGGIASNFFDYQYAAERRDLFIQDKEAYKKTRPTDKAEDPIHPDNQLPRLLNR